MKIRVAHILAALAVLFFLVGCSCNGPRVIPRGKMAHIYADMLLQDQWVLDNHSIRSQADTSLMYEPIFESYGYTTEDYRASVAHYMNDAERYSRILRKTVDILDKKLNEVKELKAIEDRRKSIVPYRMDRHKLFYYRSVDRLWEYGDSISIEMDSIVPVLEIHFHETSDTTYDGLCIIIREDSLAVKDTLLPVDSIADVDTVVKTDTVAKESEPAKTDTVEAQTSAVKQEPIHKNEAPVKKESPAKERESAARMQMEMMQMISEKVLDSLKRK